MKATLTSKIHDASSVENSNPTLLPVGLLLEVSDFFWEKETTKALQSFTKSEQQTIAAYRGSCPDKQAFGLIPA